MSVRHDRADAGSATTCNLTRSATIESAGAKKRAPLLAKTLRREKPPDVSGFSDFPARMRFGLLIYYNVYLSWPAALYAPALTPLLTFRPQVWLWLPYIPPALMFVLIFTVIFLLFSFLLMKGGLPP